MSTSFEEFVAARGVALTRFAYLLCGDRFLAEDLTQSALERCYRRWRLVGMARAPEAYVKKTITNEFVSSRRRFAARAVTIERPSTAHVPDCGQAIDLRDELWQALGALSRSHRAVLVLRYYEDLDDTAIAAVLGCTRGTVRSSASRALAALRVNPAITGRTADDRA